MRLINPTVAILASEMGDPGRPKCVGQGELFASTKPPAHMLARRYCQTCLKVEGCLELRATLASTHGAARPQGTWGGKLFDSHGRPVDVD